MFLDSQKEVVQCAHFVFLLKKTEDGWAAAGKLRKHSWVAGDLKKKKKKANPWANCVAKGDHYNWRVVT